MPIVIVKSYCMLRVLYVVFFGLLLNACSASIATYDQVAYERATSLKVESLSLMDQATTPFSDNKASIDTLLIELKKAHEYAKGRPKNDIVTKQWSVMINPQKNLVVGFLNRWASQGVLSEFFVTEAKTNISLAFDQIIGLESGLIKPEKSE